MGRPTLVETGRSVLRKALPGYLYALSEIVAAAGLVWVLSVVDHFVLRRLGFTLYHADGTPTLAGYLGYVELLALWGITVIGALSAFALSLGGLARIVRFSFPRLFGPPRPREYFRSEYYTGPES